MLLIENENLKGLLGDMTASLNLGLLEVIWKISMEFWNTVPESKEELKTHVYTATQTQTHNTHPTVHSESVSQRQRAPNGQSQKSLSNKIKWYWINNAEHKINIYGFKPI